MDNINDTDNNLNNDDNSNEDDNSKTPIVNVSETQQAKITLLEEEIKELKVEIIALKAANWDLATLTPSVEPTANTLPEPIAGLDDLLFTKSTD